MGAIGNAVESLTKSNITIEFSEVERCILISALFSIRNKQTENMYKNLIENIIEKITHA
jgi:hypothetical protein